MNGDGPMGVAMPQDIDVYEEVGVRAIGFYFPVREGVGCSPLEISLSRLEVDLDVGGAPVFAAHDVEAYVIRFTFCFPGQEDVVALYPPFKPCDHGCVSGARVRVCRHSPQEDPKGQRDEAEVCGPAAVVVVGPCGGAHVRFRLRVRLRSGSAWYAGMSKVRCVQRRWSRMRVWMRSSRSSMGVAMVIMVGRWAL